MEKEVLHNIHNAMEVLDETISDRGSKTNLKMQNQPDNLLDKATDPPMNYGDCISVIQELPGPSPKVKPQIKSSRKQNYILISLRESLNRQSKIIAKEKIKNAIKDRRTNPIVKKTRKKRRGYNIRKRLLSKYNKEGIGKNTMRGKRVAKKKNQHVLRLYPVSSKESSVSGSKGSAGSTESRSIDSQSIETESDSLTS